MPHALALQLCKLVHSQKEAWSTYRKT